MFLVVLTCRSPHLSDVPFMTGQARRNLERQRPISRQSPTAWIADYAKSEKKDRHVSGPVWSVQVSSE
ncbi:MAG: hypothetical protein VB861_15925, partial [Planctomycetaceae bacterium]